MKSCRKSIRIQFNLLKEYSHLLTKQQYKTLKGQILKGDIEGFRKGLFNIIKIKYLGEVK